MKVGIVYPRANVDTVPSLVGAVEVLAEAGHEVHVFTYAVAGQRLATFTSSRVRVHTLGVEGLAEHSTAGLRHAIKRASWLPGVARAPLIRTYSVLGAGLATGSRLAARARSAVAEREQAFDCVIGVDPDGLALAHALAHGAPLAYLSLELLLSYELVTPVDRQLKAQERDLSQQARFIIVQDEARGRLLTEDNGLDWERVVLVPNAPFGPARRRASRYWHDRFQLPAGARVVLHSGSLGAWTGIEDIVTSTSHWPDAWVLVIHTRYNAESSSYVDGLRRRSERDRVFFSLKPVPPQEYDPLIDGADVGIAFYVPDPGSSFTQRNVQTIGLSSGKLAYYLRAGLPVIVNRASSIGEVADSEGFGVAVDDAGGIPRALDRVANEYDGFSAASLAFFDSRLNFRAAFSEVLRRLELLG